MERNKKIKNKTFFSDGHLNEETIALCSEALFLGKIDTVDAEIKKHLEECSKCKAEVFAVYEEINSNENLKIQVTDNSENLFQKVKPKIRIHTFQKVAALLLALIGLSVFYYFYSAKLVDTKNSNNISVVENMSSNQDVTKNQTDSFKIAAGKKDSLFREDIRHEKGDEMLAMNMNESEFFENLISSGFRDNNSFEVSEPKNGKSYPIGQEITFRFVSASLAPLELTLYTNKEEKIFRTDSITTSVYLYNEKLGKGLYYWKVRVNKELMAAGKFYVR